MIIYDLLIDHVPVLVGNARDIKVLAHKKTDKIDSEMLALLALKRHVSSLTDTAPPPSGFPKDHSSETLSGETAAGSQKSDSQHSR